MVILSLRNVGKRRARQYSPSTYSKVQVTFFSSCSISPALITMGPRTAYSIFLTWGLIFSSDSTFHRLQATNWAPDGPCSSFRAAFEATLSTKRNIFHPTTQMDFTSRFCGAVSPSHESYCYRTTRKRCPKQSTTPPFVRSLQVKVGDLVGTGTCTNSRAKIDSS